MNQTSQFLPVYLAKIPEILLKVMADTAKQVDPNKIINHNESTRIHRYRTKWLIGTSKESNGKKR